HAAKALRRMPDGISRVFAIKEKTIKIANAYGGAISIERTNKPLAATVPPFRMEIDNAIESPLFILGRTTDVEWVDSIRSLPGPYAELVSDHTHLSLPSEYIRQLDSPSEVLVYWDEVISMQDYMGGHEHLRTHPQMIHIDWTFHGWLHAGYPVMGIPGRPAKNLVNIAFMRKKGDWGWFHELGHEAQRRPDIAWPWNNCYTFCSVEVTVNIFSSYVATNMVTDFTDGWAWVASPVKVAKNAKSYLTKAAAAEKPAVNAQLSFYMQLRDGFGWDAISNAIRSYVQQDQSKLPKTKQQKIDQWLINMSFASRHNLTRFMREVWKQPLSDEAVKAVSNLPDWMIASGGIEAVKTKAGTPVIIELQKELITFDEAGAVISAVSKPQNGTMSDNGDGTWTYAPKADYSGADTFTYTVTSGTGHTFDTEVAVTVEKS
ncbi:MAG: M60 family metallopeptidase, partial [Anaerohalosphaera sp.]|nr:M60 family metallopeptidase [Anaerohalosphaera sp.]